MLKRSQELTRKGSYQWKPYMKKDIEKIDKIISKYVTKDMFKKSDKDRYNFWKKHPVYALRHFDDMARKYGYHQSDKTKARTTSPAIILLLRIRGMNKMEQLENKDIYKNTEKKEVNPLPVSFIEEIKLRGEALATEDRAKKQLVKEAKEKGWEGLTLEEIDLDLSTNYRKLARQLEKVEEFGEDELKIFKTMQSMQKDKVDLHKFNMQMSLKIQELEERTKTREALTRKTVSLSDDMKLE